MRRHVGDLRCRELSGSEPCLLGRSFRHASGSLRAAATTASTAVFTFGGEASRTGSRKPLAKVENGGGAAPAPRSDGGKAHGAKGVSGGAAGAGAHDAATFAGFRDMLDTIGDGLGAAAHRGKAALAQAHASGLPAAPDAAALSHHLSGMRSAHASKRKR